MERVDEERPLLHLQPHQVTGSEYTSDGTVDINEQPALKYRTGRWRACFLILGRAYRDEELKQTRMTFKLFSLFPSSELLKHLPGVEFCECMASFTISKNLVTYLITVLHESKLAAARNASAWAGASFLTPLIGAFIADTYWGRYWTVVVFLPIYAIGMLALVVSASLPAFFSLSTNIGNTQHAVVYLGLCLVAIAGGGVKPCTSSFGADQFDINDPMERAKKGSFFNWYYFLISFSNMLSSTVIVWLQENVGWAVGYTIPLVLMLFCLAVFITGKRVYRLRKLGVSPLTRMLQVVVAATRKRRLQVPGDSALLYEVPCSYNGAGASHKISHTNQFRFFDKAAIVSVPTDNKFVAPMSSWRLCTVTQVEELKMLLRMSPVWASFVIFFAVTGQMSSTLIEQGMFMDNRIGSFTIPPASLSTFTVLNVLILVPVYEAVIIPLARHFTGEHKGFTQMQRLGIGLALSILTMVYAAMIETRRLAIVEASGLKNQSVPAPISILWQVPAYSVHGAAEVFASIGILEFFYDYAPDSMKSLCAALAQLAIASGLYFNSFVLSIVAITTTRGGAPGWIPDNLNEGHLDYFFWMMATLSLLNLAYFVRCSMRFGESK